MSKNYTELFSTATQLVQAGKLDEAIDIYQSIRKEASPEVLARVQLNLGLLFAKQKEDPKAIAAWQSIQREDSREQFARAQLNLGLLFEKQKEEPKAVAAWQAIQREDSREQFARAQLNLGLLFAKQKEEPKAIAAWQSIQREDSCEQFARAQFNLGLLFVKQGKESEAIEALRSIRNTDSPEQFTKAQVNLGTLFEKQGDVSEAINVWRSIQRGSLTEAFAIAQFNLGLLFEKQDESKAIVAYQSIQRNDSGEWFAKAQFNLGMLFEKQGEESKAIATWKSIQREDFHEAFAIAQLSLGKLFEKQEKASEAIAAYQSIQREDSPELFAIAQLSLGLLFEEQGEESEAIAAWGAIQEEDSFEQFIQVKIFLNYGKSDKNREILLSIFKCVEIILSQLKINHDEEENIAHYTRPSIGHFLLQMDNPSKFRLSTIKGVNDPEEGKVLSKLLKYHSDEDNLLTFISCFTFNHDSLNQFRLYGKENGEESSGISLVFNKNKFFDQNSELYAGIANSNSQILSEDKHINIPKKYTDNKIIPKLPLYRCIYLEPFDSNKPYYLHVACREELTFYRENNKGNPEDRWKGYQKAITEIEKNVKNALDTIRDSVKELNDELSTDTDLKNILEEILLPLKYLVKHSAFREEQECRMIYITDICDKRIKSDFDKNQMYVEYAPSVKDAVHKIYLSSGASKYRDHFRKLLEDKEGSKVISSTNPFRVKS